MVKVCIGTSLVFLGALSASAATTYHFDVSAGNWDNANLWRHWTAGYAQYVSGQLPGSNNPCWVQRNITIRQPDSVGYVYVGRGGVSGGTRVVTMNADVTFTTISTWVGYATFGGDFRQTKGTFVATDTLFVGYDKAGAYSLSGTASVEARGLKVGKAAIGVFTQTSGTVAAGSLQVYDQGSYRLDAGLLEVGTFTKDVGGDFIFNGGTVSADAINFSIAVGSGCALDVGKTGMETVIAGDYAQAVGGQLVVEIGGTAAGLQHDTLSISGQASLGGDLQLSIVDGFIPTLGDSFELLTYSSRDGAFDSISEIPLDDGLSLEASYGDESMRLTVVPEPTSLLLMILTGTVLAMRKRR